MASDARESTVQRQNRFLGFYSRMGSVSRAAEAAGISRTPHYSWLRRDVGGYRAKFAAAGLRWGEYVPSHCAHVDDNHIQCPKPVTYEKPLCYGHWREFDGYRTSECRKCHRFTSHVADYSYLEGFAHAVDWCYECLDRERRGFEDAVVHNHGPVTRQAHFLYILKLDGGKFYVGQTNSLELRLQEHRDGLTKTTAGKTPRLVWFEEWKGDRKGLNDQEDTMTILAMSQPRALRREINEWQRLLKLVDFEA
jgi:predicted GIY-YIG superfamily endonuclease